MIYEIIYSSGNIGQFEGDESEYQLYLAQKWTFL